jgi:hypothetical protein
VIVFKYTGEVAPAIGGITLRPVKSKLHLFDKESEKRINV